MLRAGCSWTLLALVATAPRAAQIAGTVVDDTGAAVRGANITAADGIAFIGVHTDAEGAFRIVPRAGSSRVPVRLRIHREGHFTLLPPKPVAWDRAVTATC
jgi:hypothetical protein